MKDGMFLSEYTSEHFYKIQAVSQADAGNYNCYAKNIVGTIISESIPLVVACKSFFMLTRVNVKQLLRNTVILRLPGHSKVDDFILVN